MGKKLTEREKLERKAARVTAKEKKASGLFADYVEETTADELYWKWRRDKAKGVESHTFAETANRGMGWIELAAIEKFAWHALGAEVAAPLADYIRNTYPMPDYGRAVWSDLLTGQKRLVLTMHVEPDPRPENPNRVRLVDDLVFPPPGYVPVVNRDSFLGLFPRMDHKAPNLPEPDDNGLFARTIGSLKPS